MVSDTFTRAVSIVPNSIRDIAVELFDPMPGSGEQQSAWASIQVGMSDGSVRVQRYNLVNYYSSTVINQLIALVDDIRSRANNQILPESEETNEPT